MGNRAVITASQSETKGQGIYLHWEGSLPSVLAYLDAAREIGYRCPTGDESYGMARLCGLICLMCPTADSGVGIGDLSQLDCDNYDNGVYVIGKGWELVRRWGQGSAPLTPQSIDAARASKEYKQCKQSITRILNHNQQSIA